MASPVYEGHAGNGTTTANTSHTVNMPASLAAGNLLLVYARFAGAPGTVTFTGWTQYATSTADASDDADFLFYRLSDGAEGASEALTTGNSIKAAFGATRISGAEDPSTQPPEATSAVGTGTTGDFPNITPTGGSKDYLFIIYGGQDGEGGSIATPTNYTTGFNTSNSGTAGAVATNCNIGQHWRQLTASSENPGTATFTATNSGWTAWTVAVHPAGPAGLNQNFKKRRTIQQGVNRSAVFCLGDKWARRGRLWVPRSEQIYAVTA